MLIYAEIERHKMKSKKKKKREKRIRENKHLHSIRGAYLKKYPSLFVYNKYASLDLVHEVENICKVIDFRQCPEKKRQMFSDHKTMLSHRFNKKVYAKFFRRII